MVAGPTQKSTGITNSDASPRVANTAGNGAPGFLNQVDGYVTPAASDGAGTKYLMARVPSNAVVKEVWLESEAQSAGKVNVGVYYADTALDLAGGSQNSGVVISSGFFSVDVNLASAVQPTNVTYNGGSYTIDKRSQPLWQAVGLSSDPGGKLDIVYTVHTTDITTGTGKLYCAVHYVKP
jgi:hypothetical protein